MNIELHSIKINQENTNNISINIDSQCKESEFFECCICLDNNEIDSVNLNCCKIKIHQLCFIQWIVHNGNITIKCPMCRTELKELHNIIDKDDFLNYINTLDTDNLPLYKIYNIKKIISKYYIIDLGNNQYNTFLIFYKQIYDNVFQYNILKFTMLFILLSLFIFAIIITVI